MTSSSYEAALFRAAEKCGVEPRFWDIFGHEHVASTATVEAIVKALGVPTDSSESIDRALNSQEREAWLGILPPSIVVTHRERGLTLPVTLPERVLSGAVRYRLHREEGGTDEGELRVWQSGIQERRDFGEPWVRAALELPVDVPLGYHRVEITCGNVSASSSLIVAPASAYQPEFLRSGGKAAGLTVALYGVRSARNWGFGDFTDLRALCEWAVRDLGVSFIGLNPLHAIHNRRPYNTSPYLPNSIFFQNFLYLDIEAIDEFKASRRARRCFTSERTQSELHLLRESPSVEYERVDKLKQSFLKLLFAEFLRKHWRKDSPRSREFQAYVSEGGDLLHRFALYCALDEHLHKQNPNLWIWADWPPAYQDPESTECRAFARKHWRALLFRKYAAWQITVQLKAAQEHALGCGLPLGLYHDLALATDRFGSDLWAHRDFFAPGCRVGSPPDDFSPDGQDWGFPPPNMVRHRQDGYRLFREAICKSCQHGGALRIDHVMRFFRLFWIPDGMGARQGAYVREAAEDLVRILALESVRNRVLVVGEDLGTVEPHIREMLARFGILSYRLFYFERHGDGSYRLPHEYPRQALVSSTTHDLPTLAGFWKGADIEARRAAGVLEAEAYHAQWADRVRDKQRMLDAMFRADLLPHNYSRDASHIVELDPALHHAAIAFLASTPSMLMVVNQEDLTKEPNQQNLPGTTSQYPNWGRKMKWTLEQLEHDPAAHDLTRMVRGQLREYGRRPV